MPLEEENMIIGNDWSQQVGLLHTGHVYSIVIWLHFIAISAENTSWRCQSDEGKSSKELKDCRNEHWFRSRFEASCLDFMQELQWNEGGWQWNGQDQCAAVLFGVNSLIRRWFQQLWRLCYSCRCKMPNAMLLEFFWWSLWMHVQSRMMMLMMTAAAQELQKIGGPLGYIHDIHYAKHSNPYRYGGGGGRQKHCKGTTLAILKKRNQKASSLN